MSKVEDASLGANFLLGIALLSLSPVVVADPLFDEPSYVFEVNAPYLCETADFNNDGNEDFLVTSYDPTTFSIFIGDGNGDFTCYQQAVPADIGSISICHLNDDFYPDLVVGDAMYEETIRVYLGNGSGGFQLHEVITHNHYSVNTGDLDGDGYSDLVLPYNVSSHIMIDVLLCDGEGSFVADSSYEVDLYGIAHLLSVPGDLNGDGISDLAFIPISYYRLGIMLGNGDGTLEPVYYAVSSNDNCAYYAIIEEGDFNEDGHLDLAATSGDGWADDLLLVNDGSGGFSTSDSLGNQMKWVEADDFDLDGHLDLAGSWFSLNIYKGLGDGTMGELIFSSNTSYGQLGVADFDNDGDPDLVRLNYDYSHVDDDSVFVYLNKTIQLGIDELDEIAPLFSVIASPNPFISSLSVSVQDVPEGSITPIHVFDLSGREITVIPVNGQGRAVWNGKDSTGIEVPSGVYLLNVSNECGGESTLLVLKL